MINLAELALALGIQIDHQTAAKIILHFNHMACHLALGSRN